MTIATICDVFAEIRQGAKDYMAFSLLIHYNIQDKETDAEEYQDGTR